MITLHEIGLKYKTDKATYHEYTKIYEKYFDVFRFNQLSLLEIGILDGSSLLMWNDYFINSKIYGMDIHDKTYLKTNRIEIYVGNQENKDDLKKLPKNLDIILDDGGHTMSQQQTSFKILFMENLKSGGIYVIEDLHTSLPKYFQMYGSNNNNNTLKFLTDLKNNKLSDSANYCVDYSEFYSLLKNIDFIEIYFNGDDKDNSITSIIKKK